jgi:AAA+ superfamily predicted ATPase
MLYQFGKNSSRELMRKIFGFYALGPGDFHRKAKTGAPSPEDISGFLGCAKSDVYMRRAWKKSEPDDGPKAFQKFVSQELDIITLTGRSRATFRFACLGTQEGAPPIDALVFARHQGKRLVISIGPIDPLYYGDTTMVMDLMCAAEDKSLVDSLVRRFFSDETLKGKVHKVSSSGDLRQVSVDSSLTLDDVVLAPAVSRLILDNTMGLLKMRDVYKKNGIPLKRGLIFEGPPGNGKTMVCKALAATGRFTVFWMTPTGYDDLFETYRKAAALAPSIMLFEDIDLMSSNRGGDSNKFGDLLNAMDGLVAADGVITIATTNCPEVLDKALAHRPNRFDLKIAFSNPEEATRLEMLKKFTAKQVFDGSVPLERWAQSARGLSGAQVKEACYHAVKLAIEAGRLDEQERAVLRSEDFETALASAKSGAQAAKAGFVP